MWIVDHEGAAWVRVARPERAWYQRLRANRRAELVRRGTTQPVLAQPRDDEHTRARLDRVFRERYGLVDWWYGVLLRRHAIPIRLDQAAPSRVGGP